MREPKHSAAPWTTQHGLIYSAEGHTVASCINEDGEYPDPQRGPHDAELIAEAPAMAQEVKRLRFELSCAEDMAANLEAETLQLRAEIQTLKASCERAAADAVQFQDERNWARTRMAELDAALRRIVSLDNDAHPGLFTWHDARVRAHQAAERAIASAGAVQERSTKETNDET
jgi:chromosome segregation ATPase